MKYFCKISILTLILLFSLFHTSSSVEANYDNASCSGGQGYVNGVACSQGGSVWWQCASNRCFTGSTECVFAHGSCGHWVACPKCPSEPPCDPSWGAWGTCSKTCGGGTQSRSNGCGGSQSQLCNTQPCIGTCGTRNNGVYTYPQNTWNAGTFCEPTEATSNPNPVVFPQLVGNPPQQGVSTWTCSTASGSDGQTCRAVINPPTISCGTASNNTEINNKPNSNLCVSNPSGADSVSPEVAFVDGMWKWGCAHRDFSLLRTDNCAAPSCLVNLPIDLQPFVYFNESGIPNNATIRVNCPGRDICCEIDGQDIIIGGEQKNFICTGEQGEISVPNGGSNYTAACWFKDDNTKRVTYNNLQVQTMCTARSCNSQGTCQSTPKVANQVGECSSTCNSDADCSSGRMIETRP